MKNRLVWVVLVSLFALCCMALPALAGQKTMKSEKEFIKKSASGGMMEVQLGEMAQEKGASLVVKDFGKRMVTDHGKANQELEEVLSKKRMKMPTKLAPVHKKTVARFEKLSGEAFDEKYAKEMVKDHTKDVAKFEKMSQKMKDPDLKAWVDKTLPALKQHLELAKTMAEKVGVAE